MNFFVLFSFFIASTSFLLTAERGMATVEVEKQQTTKCTAFVVNANGTRNTEEKLFGLCEPSPSRQRRMIFQILGGAAVAFGTGFITLKLAENKIDNVLEVNEKLQEEIDRIKEILQLIREVDERREEDEAIGAIYNNTRTMKILRYFGITVEQVVKEFGILPEVSENCFQDFRFAILCTDGLALQICFETNPTRRIGKLVDVFLPGQLTNSRTIYRHYLTPGAAVETKSGTVSVHRCRRLGALTKCFEIDSPCTVTNYDTCPIENRIVKNECFYTKAGNSYVLATSEKTAFLNRHGDLETITIPTSGHLMVKLEKGSKITFGKCRIEGDLETHKVDFVHHSTHLEDLLHKDIDELEKLGTKTKEEIKTMREHLGMNLNYMFNSLSDWFSGFKNLFYALIVFAIMMFSSFVAFRIVKCIWQVLRPRITIDSNSPINTSVHCSIPLEILDANHGCQLGTPNKNMSNVSPTDLLESKQEEKDTCDERLVVSNEDAHKFENASHNFVLSDRVDDSISTNEEQPKIIYSYIGVVE